MYLSNFTTCVALHADKAVVDTRGKWFRTAANKRVAHVLDTEDKDSGGLPHRQTDRVQKPKNKKVQSYQKLSLQRM